MVLFFSLQKLNDDKHEIYDFHFHYFLRDQTRMKNFYEFARGRSVEKKNYYYTFQIEY